jgi:glycosyltransferase involved in cell wall biosynthesis
MSEISIIIPTYQSPEYLDICLKSVIEGQYYKNQIIVVVDGFYEINKEVIRKYSDHIEILNLSENVGLCRATNLGVYNASFDKILIINDDNVVSKNFDRILRENYLTNSVLTPNQIEPYPSIFSQFKINNLGTEPKNFDLHEFWGYSNTISHPLTEEVGATLPIFMDKIDYLKVGGWDESYPQGIVADLDFFYKCQLAGLNMIRIYNCHFYHFTSQSVKGDKRREAELQGHEYAKYKWGNYLKRKSNNLIYI